MKHWSVGSKSAVLFDEVASFEKLDFEGAAIVFLMKGGNAVSFLGSLGRDRVRVDFASTEARDAEWERLMREIAPC